MVYPRPFLGSGLATPAYFCTGVRPYGRHFGKSVASHTSHQSIYPALTKYRYRTN